MSVTKVFAGRIGGCLGVIVWLIGTSFVCADTITYTDCNTLDCSVIKEDEKTVTILYHSSIMRVPHSSITTISKDPPPETDARIPDYCRILTKLASTSWAIDIKPIPATVIDVGIMKHVPYKSHRIGSTYEMNVYGDPLAPAGFEIGLIGAAVTDTSAQQRCLQYVSSLLQPKDQSVLDKLNRSKDLAVNDGVTLEITPPTAEDAYGGWWISVYSEPTINSARASEPELKNITVSKSAIAQTSNDDASSWTANDLKYARPSNGSSGAVYSHDYTKKDGAYASSDDLQPGQTYVGPRGGVYHYSSSGKKVYEKH